MIVHLTSSAPLVLLVELQVKPVEDDDAKSRTFELDELRTSDAWIHTEPYIRNDGRTQPVDEEPHQEEEDEGDPNRVSSFFLLTF